MFKRTLLSLTLAASALTLAACNDTTTVDDEVVEEPTTVEAVEEVNEMPETGVVEEDVVIDDPMDNAIGDRMATQNIAEMAADNENLTVLTAALQAADLDTMLMEDGEYTVFAPTDAAFNDALDKLGMTQDELLADTDTLKSVLPYHVLPMVVQASDIPYNTDIETANGQTIMISDDDTITDANGNKANIVGTDIRATNGIVHIIDTVLMPQ